MLLTPSPAAVQAASVPLSAVPPRAYIVGSYDGQELDLYVNGQLAASLPVRGHVDRAKTPLEIGAFLGHVIWAGAIDEVALYDRALAPSLISARYRLGVSPAPPGPTAYRDSVLGTPGLIGYWRLDDLGARALDQLGRNDGAYVGPVTRGFPGLISGETDHAAGFNGTGGYVTVPPARSLRVGRAFTLEAWGCNRRDRQPCDPQPRRRVLPED